MPNRKVKAIVAIDQPVSFPPSEEYRALQAKIANLKQREEKWTERLRDITTKQQNLLTAKDEMITERRERQNAVERITADFERILEPLIEPPRASSAAGKSKKKREDPSLVFQVPTDDKARAAVVEYLRRVFHLLPPRKTASSPKRRPESPRRPGTQSGGWSRYHDKSFEDEDACCPEWVDPILFAKAKEMREKRWQQEEALTACIQKIEAMEKQMDSLKHFEDVNNYALSSVKFELQPASKALELMEAELESKMAQDRTVHLPVIVSNDKRLKTPEKTPRTK